MPSNDGLAVQYQIHDANERRAYTLKIQDDGVLTIDQHGMTPRGITREQLEFAVAVLKSATDAAN